MGRKIPSDNGYTAPTGTLTGLNLIVHNICTVFHQEFNYDSINHQYYTPPRLQVFGLAERRVDAENNVYPAAPDNRGGSLTEEINLMPTDRYPGMMFFKTEEPVKSTSNNEFAAMRWAWGRYTANVDMIFYMDLSKQGVLVKWGDSLKVTKEAMRERILGIILRKLQKSGALGLTFQTYIEDNIEKVYDGYTLKEAKMQLSKPPNYALRITLEIHWRQLCTA